MATPGIGLAAMILLAGLALGAAVAADMPASADGTTPQRSADPEQLLATPAPPADDRGFQAGDSVTLVRESGPYKRTVTYVFAGADGWKLDSNLFTAKPRP